MPIEQVFADPTIIALCQSLESNGGTVSVYLFKGRLIIVPRRTADGMTVWSECSVPDTTTMVALLDFPINLYTKLCKSVDDPFAFTDPSNTTTTTGYTIKIDTNSGKCFIVNRSAEIACKGCNVSLVPPDHTTIPSDISTPDITVCLPDRLDLQRLQGRLQRFRASGGCCVSASPSGVLMFSTHGPGCQSITISFDVRAINNDNTNTSNSDSTDSGRDKYRLVGATVRLGSLIRALRVVNGQGTVDKVQFSIASREYVLMMAVIGSNRVTAILPHSID